MHSFIVPPHLLADFYKFGHIDQYPAGTNYIWTNWTPRSTRVPGQNKVVVFGMQYFIKAILMEEWTNNFFLQEKDKVVEDYRSFMTATLHLPKPRVDHIAKLHDLKYLPLKIYSLPEGVSVPLNCPTSVIVNTLPDFFWLPNFIETILSNIIWKPMTSATTAQIYRKMMTKYAVESGEEDLTPIQYMGHDFSFRGMSGREDAWLSGMGHLLSFNGTDTPPALLAAKHYYSADLNNTGTSVWATEHSVMCAGSKEGEFETFERLITKVYPSGIVSIVSDTWNLWTVLTDYVPRLKDAILARDGICVFRPDSGVPEKIVCGDPEANNYPEHEGVHRLLAKTLGVDNKRKGLPLINKARCIYGDAITPPVADRIMYRMVNELKLSIFNQVLGIGSFTYQYVTRDTYGFAMKATAVEKDGIITPIFKSPATDKGKTKWSAKGIPCVYKYRIGQGGNPGEYYLEDGAKPEDLDRCAFNKVFEDGNLLVEEDFETIRKRVRG